MRQLENNNVMIRSLVVSPREIKFANKIKHFQLEYYAYKWALLFVVGNYKSTIIVFK